MNLFERLQTEPERGNAQVEFVGVVVMLLIPIVYFMVGVSSVQSAHLAAESAAHAVARNYAISRDPSQTTSENFAIAELAFSDQGLPATQRNLTMNVGCDGDCSSESLVTSTVTYKLKLPLLGWVPGTITVKAEGHSYRGELRSHG